MAYMTRYGAQWGVVPQTSGRILWVAPSSPYTMDGQSLVASDDNDGLSPERALRTVNRAWALAVQNDIIVLLPGTHSAATSAGVATSVAANVAGVTMMGLPSGPGNPPRHRASLTCVAADETVNVTAADIEFAYINFLGDATNTGSAHVNFSAAANRFYVHDCSFDVTAQTANTGILCIDAAGAASHVCIENNYFQSDGAFGAHIDMTATLDSIVQGNILNSQSGTLAASITVAAATDRLTIRRNIFNDGSGTVTAGIDGTAATIAGGCLIYENNFGITFTKNVANFTAGEAELCNNYTGAVGGGSGGALVTATA
jgi:hypothetical protein